MKRTIRLAMIFLLLATTVFLSILLYDLLQWGNVKFDPHPQIDTAQEEKKAPIEFNDSVFSLMHQSTDEVIRLLGEPERKDLSAYQYTWWIYNDGDSYLQVGILDDRVETVYAGGEGLDSDPIAVGDSVAKLVEKYPLQQRVTFDKGIAHYTFILKDEDLRTQPLIKLDDNLFVQCYIDTFTQKVSGLRILTGDLLLRQRFYEMEYRGQLPKEITLDEEEWKKVQAGMERQIFDLTNILRKQHQLPEVKYDKIVSEVAYLHSKDMYEKQYFSHESLDGRGLKERLDERNVVYVGAGENIAAQHVDAIAAVQGWLNSQGHRESLLNEQYNYLGVGVHRLYYTQNFIVKY